MSPCVGTFLEPDDLMTWPPISSLPPMRSLYRWSRRRSHERFYTVNSNSPQANSKTPWPRQRIIDALNDNNLPAPPGNSGRGIPM